MCLGFTTQARNKLPNENRKSGTTVTAGCLPAAASSDLDLNNVRALIHTGGDMWWDLAENPRYEIPKGSGKHSLFAGGIWIGGVDVNGQLRLAARMYRQDGNDYWPGPLVASGEAIASVTPDICDRYDNHYKITKEEVETFISWYNASSESKEEDFPDYFVPQSILNWPAHGPTDAGAYDYYLAPFADVDGDGAYNPAMGDYPNFIFDKGTENCSYTPEREAENLGNASQKLFGDMTMWWVYNDKGNVHTQSTGAAAIGMEIRGQAFAFSTNDELNNMTFYNYQIINRSTYTLADAYFGVWTDADLGDEEDDFVGCDVARGLGYLYNGQAQDGDGSGKTYGAGPPAIGIDFFEGPYQDVDYNNNIDKPSSWKEPERVNLDCQEGYAYNDEGEWVSTGEGDIFNGSINGLNFGDGKAGNERWGMRRFLYFNAEDTDQGKTDPNTAIEFYNYLRGIWKDGTRMTYGNTGYQDGTINADFMFPFDTDVCGWGTSANVQDAWSEESVDNSPGDRRFVQSAGPFSLEPGAVNDITVGVVWADANSTPWESVEAVRKADIKAQRLFENCFQLMDGPRAPDLDIVELSNSLIFHISNKIGSNNYLESYSERDPFIDVDIPVEDQYYTFQGYQVYQLKNQTVTTADLDDNDLARQVFQCDLADEITQLVNFDWDPDLQASIPIEKVQGSNEGIVHSFEITNDAFATGSNSKLVNYKDYYYVAIAYAYNNYAPYDPVNEGSIGKQTQPYLAGRENIMVYSATPNSIESQNGGTEINSEYGMTPIIHFVEGRGNGYNYLRLTESTIENILSKTESPFKADSVQYQSNYGPVDVKVIDPINLISTDFKLTLIQDSVNYEEGHFNEPDSSNINWYTGLIYDTKWELEWQIDDEIKTVISDSWIRYKNEMLLPEIGLSIEFSQVDFPGQESGFFQNLDNINNGFIGAELIYDNDVDQWIDFLENVDGTTYQNWIRCGKVESEENPEWNDYIGRDPDEVYEKVLGGTWAPYCLTSDIEYGPANSFSQPTNIQFQRYRLPSVDLVITKDKDLWTRCPVVEMAENDDESGTSNSISEGGALRFQLRAASSRDKDGNFDTNLTNDNLTDEDASNYIGATGMSWFPGYAIDVETGERLNIVFGEDSWLVGDNGNDMLWNPTSNLGTGYNPKMGGKHFIYIFGHNEVLNNEMPTYDFGKTFYNALHPKLTDYERRNNERDIWKHAAWTCIPMVKIDYEYISYSDMSDNNLKIELRTANPYFQGVGEFAVDDPKNSNYPSFKFNTSALGVIQNNTDFGKKALEKVNIVPNPYYGYSEYEQTQIDNLVKITNLPERCVISIYTPSGNLVRKFDKDNSQTYITWDLKNTYGVSIASGVYIIHISSPDLGEKVIKWFGSMRPIDLNSF